MTRNPTRPSMSLAEGKNVFLEYLQINMMQYDLGFFQDMQATLAAIAPHMYKQLLLQYMQVYLAVQEVRAVLSPISPDFVYCDRLHRKIAIQEY